MKRPILITFVFVILTVSQTLGQVKFDPQIIGNFGYENNIFRSPDIIELTDGTVLDETDLILSDSYFDFGYDLYLKYKPTRKHIFRLNHDLWKRMYSNNTNLNQFKTNFKFNYDYRIVKHMHIGIVYRYDRVNKIGTSVLGDELTQQFSYNKNTFQLHYKYRFLKNTAVDLSAAYYIKTFDKLANVIPLDYSNINYSMGLSQKFNINKLILKAKLDLDYTSKSFTEKIASDVDGREFNTNPLRIWNYYSGKFSIKGRFSNGFEFTPCIKYRVRKDMFEDYYSYNALSFGLNLGYESEKLEVSLFPKYQSLNYLVKTAPDPNSIANPQLNYSYMTGHFEISYKVFKGLYVSFEYANKLRETNTLDFSRKTRRAYKYYELMGGLIIKPMEFFN